MLLSGNKDRRAEIPLEPRRFGIEMVCTYKNGKTRDISVEKIVSGLLGFFTVTLDVVKD